MKSASGKKKAQAHKHKIFQKLKIVGVIPAFKTGFSCIYYLIIDQYQFYCITVRLIKPQYFI